ncbi:MAG: tetratricopeptide repeat protein [Cyclobacteriaceae bacterium]
MKFSKGWHLFLFLLFLSTRSVCQTALPDSLATRFSDIPKDTAYILQLNKLATDYLKVNPALSRRIATVVTEQAPALKYVKGHARALTIIGNSYWFEGVYELAQNNYLLAARQYESIHDSIGLGQNYNNIAEVYKKMSEYKKALEYLLAAFDLKKGDNTQAITLYNIGELYVITGELPLALTYFERSLSLARAINNQRVVGYSFSGFGLVCTKQKKYKEAIEHFKRAEKIWKELGEIRLVIQNYQNMADVYRELNLFEESEHYLTLSIEMARLIKVPDIQVNNYLKLSRLDSARGHYLQAFVNLYRYTTLKDSVYNLAKSDQIARLQLAFETEAKEQENRQLRSDQHFKESQLQLQRQIIFAISIGLVIAGIMAWLLYRQRHKTLSVNKILQEKNEEIQTQKLAIEMQATALIKLNEELQELNKNLESRIAIRTQQLTDQNQKLMEYAFINAHKLRAPISSILGLINLIDQAKPEEYETIFTHLKTCGIQLDAITRQISRSLEGGIHDHQEVT